MVADLIETFAKRWGADLQLMQSPPETHLNYTVVVGDHRSDSTYNGKIDSLRLIFSGRWGNYVLQLVNMFHIAKETGARRLYIIPTDVIAPPARRSAHHGIKVRSVFTPPDPAEHTLVGVFFAPEPLGELMRTLTPRRRGEIARTHVRPLMQGVVEAADVGADDLVIHLRSGDIFQGPEGDGGASPGGDLYVQPPLSFYQRAVQRAMDERPGVVHVVAENARNPVILPLVDWLDRTGRPVTVRLNRDLRGDLGVLLAGRRVVFANGTFGMAVALLSSRLEDAFFFRDDGTGTGETIDVFVDDRVRKHVAVDRTGTYIAVRHWRNTSEQRDFMCQFPADQLGWSGEDEDTHVFRTGGDPSAALIRRRDEPEFRDGVGSWIGGGGRAYYDIVWKALTDAKVQSRFRREPDYNVILEHVSEAQGRDYLSRIDDPVILDVCARSEVADPVGAPLVFDYNGRKLSPTTLRYAKVTQDLARYFPGLADIESIVEIGCGYGGQARFISEYARATDSRRSGYTLVDMLPVILLASQYLERFSLKFRCDYVTKSQIKADDRWDLLISNYAFSEFSRELQDEYMERVVRRARSGYLTMNTGLPGRSGWNRDAWTVEELMRTLPNAALRREDPCTNLGNYILLFGDHAADIGLTPDDVLSP